MIISSEIVKQSIIKRLIELFPNAKVYKESISTPSYPHFFVTQLTLSDEEERKNYHLMDYSMIIRYRVASDPTIDLKLNSDLDNVGMKLLQGFNIIDCEDSKIRFSDKSTEKVDGVLFFNCNVRIMAKVIDDSEHIKLKKMEVKINGN